MRSRLKRCFENMEMTPFPGCQLKSIPMFTEEVYCSCRMPQPGKEKIAQCNQCLRWYHQKYEDIPKLVFSKSKNRTIFFIVSIVSGLLLFLLLFSV